MLEIEAVPFTHDWPRVHSISYALTKHPETDKPGSHFSIGKDQKQALRSQELQKQ